MSEMSKTVWALTQGSYSDYRVKALFPTEKIAKAAESASVAADNAAGWGWGQYDVEPLELYDEIPETVTEYRVQETLWDDGTKTEYQEGAVGGRDGRDDMTGG